MKLSESLHVLNEYLPLKQGLRLKPAIVLIPAAIILNEYLPLKQGLRLIELKKVLAKDVSMSIFH